MNGKRILVSAIALLCALALAFSPAEAQKKKGGKRGKGKAGAAAINTLSEQEKAEGWKLLFDGKTFDGWHVLNKGEKDLSPNFEIVDGTIHKKVAKPAGDLATIKGWNNFELTFEWKLAEAANNGIKYNVSPELSKGSSALGFEYQVIDDKKAADNKVDTHSCGSLYELVAADPGKEVKAIGEWNQSKIVYNGNKIEHWLNGKKIVEAEVGSPELNKALEASKWWKSYGAEFGKRRTDGVIVITDHNDEVWYRNIKIREL